MLLLKSTFCLILARCFRHKDFNKRISHFARNLGIGSNQDLPDASPSDASPSTSSSDLLAAFYCSVLARYATPFSFAWIRCDIHQCVLSFRAISQDAVSERMSKPECTIDMDAAMAAVDFCMPPKSVIAASPQLKANLLSSAKVQF